MHVATNAFKSSLGLWHMYVMGPLGLANFVPSIALITLPIYKTTKVSNRVVVWIGP